MKKNLICETKKIDILFALLLNTAALLNAVSIYLLVFTDKI